MFDYKSQRYISPPEKVSKKFEIVEHSVEPRDDALGAATVAPRIRTSLSLMEVATRKKFPDRVPGKFSGVCGPFKCF